MAQVAQDEVMQKSKAPPQRSIYKCMMCNDEFSNVGALNEHKEVIHSDPVQQSELKYNCDKCDFKTINENTLSVHIGTSHEGYLEQQPINSSETCSACQHQTENMTTLIKHVMEMHGGSEEFKEIKCPHCEAILSEERKLEEHIQDIHQLKCSDCEKTFQKADALQQHTSTEHMQSCNHCNYESVSKDAVNKHIRSAHPGLSVVICGV